MNKYVLGLVVATLAICCCVPACAFGLAEGRVYEMVSPPYKGGYGANAIERVATDGESIVFGSLGVFEDEPTGQPLNFYLSRRDGAGWSTVPVNVPATSSATSSPNSELDAYSANLESVLARIKPGPNGGAAVYGSGDSEFLSHKTDTPDTAVDWSLGGEVLKPLVPEPSGEIAYEGVSAEFSHVIFASKPILVAAENAQLQLYDLETSGADAPSLRLVGVNNDGTGEVIDPECQVALGSDIGKGSRFNAVSEDGEEVFFASNVEPAQGIRCENNPSNPEQLFVRLGGVRTLEVSKPLSPTCEEVPCRPGAETRASAHFVGASDNGSKVFFTTTAPLVGEDGDTANDLYMATIGCAGGGEECEEGTKQVTSVVQLSHDPNNTEAAEVQGVVNMASNGSHVYFVAKGVLTSVPDVGAQGYGMQGEPVSEGAVAQSGADNLYAIDTETMQISFVADLCSASGLSGQLVDYACPLGVGPGDEDALLWTREVAESQTSSIRGGFLVFSSYGRLVANDANAAKDVYWYDAETGELERVSAGEAGADANGNGDLGASIALTRNEPNPNEPTISEDGTRVVFTSAEPLSEDAVNNLSNAYEWHEEAGSNEGHVSMVSTGSADEPVERVVIAATGRDIFFVTSQSLAPQDADDADDVYDARLGGGFPLAPAPLRPCSAGDACQGPLSVPAPLLIPGSVSQESGGNFAAPPSKKPATKPKKSKKKTKKKKGRSGRNLKKARRSAVRRGR